jgi:RTX calcium-binding nonapeptide repeat (4 copies)
VPSAAVGDWHEVGGGAVAQSSRPISGYDLKRVNGAPEAAWSQWNGHHYVVKVARFEAGANRWVQLGPVLNHDFTRDATEPSLAASPGGVPWVAWTEPDAHGISQVHVARWDSSAGRWTEPDGRAFALNRVPHDWRNWDPEAFGASLPRLVFLGDRPYVVDRGNNPFRFELDVFRLAPAGHSWDLIGAGVATPTPRPGGPMAAVLGGRLYVASRTEHESSVVAGLGPDGRWRAISNRRVTVENPCGGTYDYHVTGIAEFQGLVDALWSSEVTYDCTGKHGGRAYVSAFNAGSSELVGAGAVADNASGADIKVVGGRLYVAWIQKGFRERVRVSRLADDGGSWLQLSDPVGAPVSRGGILSAIDGVPYLAIVARSGGAEGLRVERLEGVEAPVGPDDGEGSGPGTDPHVTPLPNYRPRFGRCGWFIDGTNRSDYLRGYHRAEIHGRAGDDTIWGTDGNDCLYGGRGADVLYGNAGKDTFYGGPGPDEINSFDENADTVYCGSGIDRVVADDEDRLHGCEHVTVRR